MAFPHKMAFLHKMMVSRSQLRCLPVRFARLPVQAFLCRLLYQGTGPPSWNDEQTAMLRSLVNGRSLVALLSCYSERDKCYSVVLLDQHNSRSINGELSRCAHSTRCANTTLFQIEAGGDGGDGDGEGGDDCGGSGEDCGGGGCEDFSISSRETKLSLKLVSPYEQLTFRPGQSLDVQVSSISTPGEFSCQLMKHVSSLKRLMHMLQLSCDNATYKPIAFPGPCAARCNVDRRWHRGFALGPVQNGTQVCVVFVDYGNDDLVMVQDLLPLPDCFLSDPAYAFRCCLYKLTSVSNCWSTDAADVFQELVEDLLKSGTPMKCNVFMLLGLASGENTYVVDISTPFQDVSGTLVSRRFARYLEVPALLAPGETFRSFCYSSHGLKVGSEATVAVVCVKSLSCFFCHLKSNNDQLEAFGKALNDYCNSFCDWYAESLLVPGVVVVALFSSDHCWYRAVVQSDPETDGTVTVEFVDYGNFEKVPAAMVRSISAPFLTQPRMSIPCCIVGSCLDAQKTWSSQVLDCVADLTKSDNLQCKFLHKCDSLWEPMQSCAALVNDAASLVQEEDEDESIVGKLPTVFESPMEPGTRCDVYISVASSPLDFWCQLKVNADGPLWDLMQAIEEQDVTGLAISGPLPPTTFCLARYGEDGALYRACVMETREGSTSVHFVDFGNSDDVNMEDIKQIPIGLANVPPFAFHCQLEGWSSTHEIGFAVFQNLAIEKSFNMEVWSGCIITEFKGKALERQVVLKAVAVVLQLCLGLIAPQKELLIPKSAPSPWPENELCVGQSSPVFLTVVNPNCSFALQLQSWQEVIEGVQSELINVGEELELLTNSPRLGQPCVARYSADDLLYRAEVASLEPGSITVRYVDFGNFETLSHADIKLYELPSSLLAVPALSVQCYVKGLPEHSPAVAAKVCDYLWPFIESSVLCATFCFGISSENQLDLLLVHWPSGDRDQSGESGNLQGSCELETKIQATVEQFQSPVFINHGATLSESNFKEVPVCERVQDDVCDGMVHLICVSDVKNERDDDYDELHETSLPGTNASKEASQKSHFAVPVKELFAEEHAEEENIDKLNEQSIDVESTGVQATCTMLEDDTHSIFPFKSVAEIWKDVENRDFSLHEKGIEEDTMPWQTIFPNDYSADLKNDDGVKEMDEKIMFHVTSPLPELRISQDAKNNETIAELCPTLVQELSSCNLDSSNEHLLEHAPTEFGTTSEAPSILSMEVENSQEGEITITMLADEDEATLVPLKNDDLAALAGGDTKGITFSTICCQSAFLCWSPECSTSPFGSDALAESEEPCVTGVCNPDGAVVVEGRSPEMFFEELSNSKDKDTEVVKLGGENDLQGALLPELSTCQNNTPLDEHVNHLRLNKSDFQCKVWRENNQI
uniref:Tudor domain-containing protein n=1 Tax=Eptatretus burgeri TaxID=7764 RepID=A0A8C4NGZ3_EPTBU